jgi:D-aminoacyl-tRNA deacylase
LKDKQNSKRKVCIALIFKLAENNFHMRVVIQKVSEAKVEVEKKVVSSVGKGLLILLGIEDADTDEDIDWLVKKTVQLRIFNDENGVMNQSVQDVGGDMIVVSQFTLHANTKKGNRPSYIRAAKPDFAVLMYEKFIAKTEAVLNKKVGTGIFGAMMEVSLVNDGPVTIIIDSKMKDF